MLQLAYVGGLGHMASPAAHHLVHGGPARVLRVHDRGGPGQRRDERRTAWRNHGARLVPNLAELVGEARDLDGVVVCCGKNGDDLAVVAELVARLGKAGGRPPALLHMSTVSPGFAVAAGEFAAARGVAYANYPLTGGPLGAQRGGDHPQGMLILASGGRATYERFESVLERLGHPRFLGTGVAAGAETKLIGQHMVFDGCTGIGTAAALHAMCFADGGFGGAEQVAFFEFLNGGAGGTRQWDVALSKGVRDGEWEQGFMLRHAAVDAIYAAQLAMERGLPRLSVQPMVSIASAFAFMMRKYPVELATHAVTRELVGESARELDAFMAEWGVWGDDLGECLQRCVAALPDDVRATVGLEISAKDFEAAARGL